MSLNQPADALALGIEHATRVMMMYTEDLKAGDWLHRPCPSANCAAWTMGHLILTSRSMMTRAGATDLPTLPDGFEKRFARDDTAPKSADYGDTSVLRPLFEQHHQRMAAVARGLSAEKLNASLGSDHPFFKTVGTMLAFAPIHIGTHAGQISTIRRSMGRPPLV